MSLPHVGNLTAAFPREQHLNRYLWALLAVTNLVDLLASRRAFELGIDELNPIVEALFSAYGIASIAAFKLLWLVILLVLIPHIRGWTQAFLAFACVVYLGLTALHIARLSPLL
jgi:Domain of unknown function (DUF5658)